MGLRYLAPHAPHSPTLIYKSTVREKWEYPRKMERHFQIKPDSCHFLFLFRISECFPLCQRFRIFRSEFKWRGPFRLLPTGIFGITSGGGPLILVGIFRPKFAVSFLTNRFFALIREFRKGIKSGRSHSYWLARFNRKMLFHFPRVFPLISDRSVWHNGKHP